MEHRWGNRVAVDIEVQIFVDPASTAWGRLRNISVTGGFIETGLNMPALSTLHMTVRAAHVDRVHAVRAVVVRSEGSGVGVEWFDSDSELVSRLIHQARAWHMPVVFATDGRRPRATLQR